MRADVRAFWTLVFVPLLLAVMCLPMALEQIEPNAFYGVRTAATRASEAEWYRINRIAGIAGVFAGLAGFSANLIIARADMAVRRKTVASLAVLIGVALGIVVAALAAA